MQIEEVHSEQKEAATGFEFVALPDNQNYFPNFLKKETTERFFRW
jgi:hypothetical protein